MFPIKKFEKCILKISSCLEISNISNCSKFQVSTYKISNVSLICFLVASQKKKCQYFIIKT